MEKFWEKSFTPLFEDYAPWFVLVFLSRHPPFTIFAFYLRIVSRSDFFPEVFAFLFQRRITPLQRVIFKTLEKIASLLTPFFVNPLFISRCFIPTPSHRRPCRPCLSFIWMGGSFRPMKFESRPGRKPGDNESCLSFLPGVGEQRT